MNQILITENNNNSDNRKVNKVKNRNNADNEITTIIKVFAVLILIFGVILSGNGVYAIANEIKIAQETKIPVVTTQRTGNAVTISIQSEVGIRTMVYSWNDTTETVIQGRNKTELEQTVTIPAGDNRLNISVIDSQGKQTKFVKNFVQAEIDTTKPEITFEVVDSNIKIIATDDTEIDYIVYKYGDSAEVKVEAKAKGQITIEELVQVSQGQSTLKVEAVDKSQNFATAEQEIKGVKKPIIEVIPDPNDPSYLIIKASDEEALRMVSYYINDQEYKTDPSTSLNTKTFEWKQKVEPGETRVTVHAYSVNEQVTEFIGIYNY